MDIGTGDGRAVLARARRDPSTLVVGVDSDAEAMRRTSQRAAAKPARGGLANALFLVAAAETLPGPLCGRADIVTVSLPWGALLRGLVTADPRFVEPLVATLRARGVLQLLLSIGPSDRRMGLDPMDEHAADRLAAAYRQFGLVPLEARLAADSDVAALHSTWARRLGIPRARQGWVFRFGTAAHLRGV